MRPSKEKLIELEKVLTSAEIAKHYSVTPGTVRKWHNKYGLTGYPSGGRFSKEAIQKKRRNNCLQWLSKCKKKFGSKFDYSKAEKEYETEKRPEVTILCKAHKHEFLKSPHNHIRFMYGGCEHCEREGVLADNLEKSRTNFLIWFEAKHAERLEIVSDFAGMAKPLDFRCKVHKTTESFFPTNLLHNSSWGCSACSKKAMSNAVRLDHNELKTKLEPTLPDGINIASISFDEAKGSTMVEINCDLHGPQQPSTVSFIKRSQTKCKDCSRLLKGYTEVKLRRLIDAGERGKLCTLGVMEMEVYNISAMKVGVTTRGLKERYLWYLKTIFYSVQLFEIDAYVLENRIKLAFGEFKDKRILRAGMRSGERWPGDTEFYVFNQKELIINFINEFLEELPKGKIDYEVELGKMLIPVSEPISTDREKGVFQGPEPVIGIDSETNEILHRFASIADAEKLGFDNISLVTSGKRNHSLGVRWFKANEFDPDNIPPIEIPNAQPVYCVERRQHFRSTMDAETQMRAEGFKVTGSKISAVLNGHRAKAGGFTWQRSMSTTQEILNQSPESLVNFTPAQNANAKKKVKLIPIKSSAKTEVYNSLSQAAKTVGTSAGNISLAVKNGSIVKGYKAEFVKE